MLASEEAKTTIESTSEEQPVETVSAESRTDQTPVVLDKRQLLLKEKLKEVETSIQTRIDENPFVNGRSYRNLATASKLMEIGTHIGLIAKRWNPQMKPFIWVRKKNNHIIDLYHTLFALNSAYNYLLDFTKDHLDSPHLPLLVVGTKGNVIKNHVKELAKKAQTFYINERWLGGTLTNFSTITKSIGKFNQLLLLYKTGEISKHTKKEQVMLKKQLEKYAKHFAGIRTMQKLPKLMILTDPVNNKIALKEAKKLGIPVIALCNTNADPNEIDYPIPANNNSIRTVYLLLGVLFDAINEARKLPSEFAEKKDEEIVLPEIVRKKLILKKVPYNLRY